MKEVNYDLGAITGGSSSRQHYRQVEKGGIWRLAFCIPVRSVSPSRVGSGTVLF